MIESTLVHANGALFSTRDYGGVGPDLLFVHGTGHNLEVWNPLVETLRDKFRMVAFDLRGHGQTPAESTDAEQYWRDIAALIPALGLNSPLLVGHSTGGYDQITVPAGFVLAARGLYGNREEDLKRVVSARPNRYFVKQDCGHNVHMLKATEIAEFIVSRFR